MKKILSLSICLLLVFSLFCFTAGAEPETQMIAADENAKIKAEFNADFTKIECGGNSYSVIDSELLDEYGLEYSYTVNLTKEQQKTVSRLELNFDYKYAIIDAVYNLRSGMRISALYLNDKYLSDYVALKQGEIKDAEINFIYPEDNNLKIELQKLKQNKTVKYMDGENVQTFPVRVKGEKCKYDFKTGFLVVSDENYYYIDSAETNVKSESVFYDNLDQKYEVYVIKNPETLAILKDCYKKYSSDYEIFNDTEFAKIFSKVLSIIVFGIIPLAVLIVSLILGLKSKTEYRKMLLLLSGLSLVEIIVYIITYILLF